MVNDVFISYTQPDRNKALYIHDMLQANGLISWVAPSRYNGIATGTPYESQVIKAIQSSKVFVLVYSKYCNESGDVLQEVRHRYKGHKTIVVRLDGSMFRDELSYHLKGIQHIDATQELFAAVNRLLQDVKNSIDHAESLKVGSTDQLLFSNGLKMIEQKKYQEAIEIFKQHLQIEPCSCETRVYLSLAIIGGKKIRKLDGLLVRKLENILQPAINNNDDPGYANVLLAVIKQSYYLENGLKMPEPSVEQLMKGVVLNTLKTQELLVHLYEPENVVWQFLSKQIYKH